jgi:antibiotic biosynthesis monooxygenase (ABM) superfamily enzyme
MRTCMHILLFCFNFVPSNFNFFIGPQVTFIELWRHFLFQPLVFLSHTGFQFLQKLRKTYSEVFTQEQKL